MTGPSLSEEFKRTLDNADEFGRAMAALAESGSSDQDSDSEPHGGKLSGLLPLAPHEHAKVTEKMRASQATAVLHTVRVCKEPGEMSYGFSIADGQYDCGVYVKTVKPGGPSDRGGLLQYDKIVKVCVVCTYIRTYVSSLCCFVSCCASRSIFLWVYS